MAKKTRNAIEILERLTGDDPELRAMIAEETAAWDLEVARRVEEIRSVCASGTPAEEVFAEMHVKPIAGRTKDMSIEEASRLSERDLLSPEAQADLWQSWIEKGPQGPIEDEEDSKLP